MIYTKTGDNGTTALFGGRRVSKSVVRMEVIGCVDELNSHIGLIRALLAKLKTNSENEEFEKIIESLNQTQKDLLQVGADLATSYSTKASFQKNIDRIALDQVTRLEKEIDDMEKLLPKLKYFILPGGDEIASSVQIARAICRRAERNAVRLTKGAKVNENILKYLNRLSDWFFVSARFVNYKLEVEEEVWK